VSKFLRQQTIGSNSTEEQSAEQLQKRIDVLERKSTREKRARHLAEAQLEEYSLKIYQTNQSLKSALAFSTKKQSELEYLGQASMAVASELSLEDMIGKMIELTCQYCAAGYGFYFVTEDGVSVDKRLDKVWSNEKGWQSNTKLQKLVKSNLPLDETDVLESWLVSAVSFDNETSFEPFDWLLYMNFALSGGRLGWLAFLSNTHHVDEELFPILATAKGHLTSGIRRRLTDLRILKRNEQLQDSINKLENAKRQLIQSEKMASLGQLAAGVAHEINNPVAFVRSNMEVLKEYLDDYRKLLVDIRKSSQKNQIVGLEDFEKICQKVDLEYIEEDSDDLIISNIEGLERIKEIVENLKGFSHSGDQALKKMSLYECILAALKITGNAFKYEHKIDNQLSSLCPKIVGNLGQLQQVFVNLFVNAAYAMDGKGELTISQTEKRGRVLLHIKDTGCGMDASTVSQLFTPFFTTKPVGVGTGLGLSVSYAILEAHGAEVTVDSEVGVGTIFHVSFPIKA
jgi:signal transduction histidine kinase